MKFIVNKKRSPNKEEILKDIKLVLEKTGKVSITIKDYDENGTYCSSTAIRKFGSWNKMLTQLQIPVNNMFYSFENLMDNIRDAWLKKEEQPTRHDMDNSEFSSISSNAYLRHFGTWYNALDRFVEYISQTNDDGILSPVVENEEVGYKHKTKREPSSRLKVLVLMRDGNRCRICGVQCNDGIHKIHFDHIKPWAKGGETTLDNLRILCSNCNEALGDADMV